MKKILISGYYGYDNMGDEAVLSGIVSTLSETCDAAITVLSANPKKTAATYNIRAVYRYNPYVILKEIASCDLFISGGGSLLQDVTSRRTIYYYLALIRFAQFFGKKTMIYAQGIGPIVSKRAQKAVAKTINYCDAITVRDENSKAFLNSIGVTKPVTVVGDPALIVSSKEYTKRDFIAVSIRNWQSNKWLTSLKEALDIVKNKHGYKIIVLPMYKTDDLAISEALGFDVEKSLDTPNEVKGFFGAAKAVVGMRLHSLIFAAGEGRPIVALSYDPKVMAFADICGKKAWDINVDIDPQRLAHDIINTCNEESPDFDKIRLSAFISGEYVSRLLEQSR